VCIFTHSHAEPAKHAVARAASSMAIAFMGASEHLTPCCPAPNGVGVEQLIMHFHSLSFSFNGKATKSTNLLLRHQRPSRAIQGSGQEVTCTKIFNNHRLIVASSPPLGFDFPTATLTSQQISNTLVASIMKQCFHLSCYPNFRSRP